MATETRVQTYRVIETEKNNICATKLPTLVVCVPVFGFIMVFVVLVATEKREAKDKIQQSASRFQALSAQRLVSLTLFLVVFSRGTFTPHSQRNGNY